MIAPDPGRGTVLLGAALALLLTPVPSFPLPGAGAHPGPSGLAAQVQEPRVGSVEAGLLLRRMDGEKRVLMIGAHPDDEDTALLAVLARGLGARTAYLSLSRGEGGQNVIGPELGEGLGLVRTGELLSARSLDGAEQLFTRAFDFGFSKSAEETFHHWPREELLRDVVWVVRTFRPHVIVSIFSGTPRDGHGQHQASGVVAHAAFDAAADPARFPDQLDLGAVPWAPSKLYRLVRRNPEAATVSIPTGTLDPLLGRSHFQVAMESRSRHRSQDMGVPRIPGPRRTGAELAGIRVTLPDGVDDGLFAGVDTTLQGLARAADAQDPEALARGIDAYREALREAGEALHAVHPDRAAPHLSRARARATAALELARSVPEGPGRTELIAVLEDRVRTAGDALLAASSVVVDVRAGRAHVVPGEHLEVEVLVWNGGPKALEIRDLSLSVPPGWAVLGTVAGAPGSGDGVQAFFAPDERTAARSLPSPSDPAVLPAGDLRRWALRVQVPEDAALSRPWFMAEPRDGSLYRWGDDPELWARPLNPPLIRGTVTLRTASDTLSHGWFRVERAGAHVGVDPVDGEYRVPVYVVPAVSVEVDPVGMAWPEDGPGERTLTVRAVNLSDAPLSGEVLLSAPEGWRLEVAAEGDPRGAGGGPRVELAPRGGEASRTFTLRPAAPGSGIPAVVGASLRVGDREYSEGLGMVDYHHLDPMPLFRPAELRISHFPVRTRPGLRVGYVMGSGDEGPRALRDLGVDVEMLDAEALRRGDLARFHTVVLGIRAYETRADLIAANESLLEFARRGGTVVVQYHRYEYPAGGFAPFPVTIARPHDRITDPDAPVTLLDPEHPALRTPNRLAEDDFRGWVQERGLYFLAEWDDRFVPLLEMADPDEAPSRGGLMVARFGEGAYVYTGLALFRQLPAGVPGAYRLLANLVSLRGEDL